MPTETTLTEETKQALDSALEQSNNGAELLENLQQVPPPQCSPHGSRCKALAIEYLLNTAEGTKREILLDLLSEPVSGSNLILALNFE
jgi:hypothetical protein